MPGKSRRSPASTASRPGSGVVTIAQRVPVLNASEAPFGENSGYPAGPGDPLPFGRERRGRDHAASNRVVREQLPVWGRSPEGPAEATTVAPVRVDDDEQFGVVVAVVAHDRHGRAVGENVR